LFGLKSEKIKIIIKPIKDLVCYDTINKRDYSCLSTSEYCQLHKKIKKYPYIRWKIKKITFQLMMGSFFGIGNNK